MDNPLNFDEYEGASMAQFEVIASAPTTSKRVQASRNDSKTKYSGGQVGEYDNIAKGILPEGDSNGCINVRDAIELMQKAYHNIAAISSAIDTMTELSNSAIKFVGKNKASVKFFTAWEKRIGNWDFRSRFFREYFLSGNCFLYAINGDLTYSDFRKVTRASITKKIPIRYVVLDPKSIRCDGGASFVNATYSKVLNDYEVARLKDPKTDEERELFDSLDDEAKKALRVGQRPSILLKQENLTAIFNSKQDYYGMAIPKFFPVLTDCNFKIEMRKTEAILARACDKYILLITCGEAGRDMALNEKLRLGLTQLFASESVGRVLISDYTTTASFILPDLNKIFGVDKYKAVNEDIANSLMNIFWKDESFSNSMIKTQIFLERLKTARETYENLFLIPQMEKIAKELGFQEIPEIKWVDFALKDDLEQKKLYVRLAELGLLTPQETFEAFETNQLPNSDYSIESQKEFKKLKDQELYVPLLNKPADPAGRPKGAKAPKKKITVSPVGANTEVKFSLAQISENIKLANSISVLVDEAYKQKNGIARLSKKHKSVTDMIWSSLITNEPKSEWESKVAEYLVETKDFGEKTDEVFTLAAKHSVDPVMGAILNSSQSE